MTRPEQRARERALLDWVLGVLGLEPDELIEGPDPPDFVMTIDGSRISVEVTEYHSDPKRRQEEEMWSDVRAVARR